MNPLFEDDDGYSNQEMIKHSTIKGYPSYSSGYGSSQGKGSNQLVIKVTHALTGSKNKSLNQTVNDRKKKIRCQGIPHPVWPRTKEGSTLVQIETGLERKINFPTGYKNMHRGFHHWVHANKSDRSGEVINLNFPKMNNYVDIQEESVETNSDDYDSIVTDSLLFMTASPKHRMADESRSTNEKTTEAMSKHHEDMEKVIKQLTEALSRSRRFSSLKGALSRGDRRNKNHFVPRSIRNKSYVNLNWRSRYNNKKSKQKVKDTKMSDHEKTSVSSRSSDSSLQLSALNLLSDYDRQDYTGLERNLYSNLSLSSWTPGGQTNHLDRSGCWSQNFTYERLGNSYDNFYQRRKKRTLGKRHENVRLIIMFCKTFCFVLLMVGFIFVIVIVSVFLAKGINRSV